ncbi:hypothetical protein KP509_20G069800 [Ceratopteris richardii]|uniref:SKP1 component dimerisation domain-containing protein n=1 Tax=Ceratopteris richardii TaxID=49495 RepID=A0A8T2SJK4_CERRI|nr:hypothetical protein KP509_20G069800 [Ceratopteris richardii]
MRKENPRTPSGHSGGRRTVAGSYRPLDTMKKTERTQPTHTRTQNGLFIMIVRDMIKEKTPEEIRRAFNIENDFTPEEEEEVRRENQWAFE